MLKINLIVVGDKMPQWVEQGYNEYEKRIRRQAQLKLVEIAASKRGKNADIARIIKTEEKKIRNAIPKNAHVVALDRLGKPWSTLQVAEKIRSWLPVGNQVALIVGGPEGLSEAFRKDCNELWSLSALTFAHPLVRVILAEQLYRCFSILDGSPYHR